MPLLSSTGGGGRKRGVGPCRIHNGYVDGQQRVLIIVFGKPEEGVRTGVAPS